MVRPPAEGTSDPQLSEATHRLFDAAEAGLRTPEGKALEDASEAQIIRSEDHQVKAADYTLAEVILATSLFLFGIAGISSTWRIKIRGLRDGDDRLPRRELALVGAA